MSSIHLSLALPSPLTPVSVRVPSSTRLSTILPSYCPELASSSSSLLYLRTRSAIPDQDATVLDIAQDEDVTEMDLQVACRMLGGKGGFGAMLRATGGKMSSQKASNNDSCRDLSGRRLRTIKEAKKMGELLELESNHKKVTSDAARLKLEALERSLGITHAPTDGNNAVASSSSSSNPTPNEGSDNEDEGAPSPEGGRPAGSTKLTTEDLKQLAGKKHRFDDSEYLEQSREINDNVRSAVSAGLLKKRKKAKLSAAAGGASPVVATPTAPITIA